MRIKVSLSVLAVMLFILTACGGQAVETEASATATMAPANPAPTAVTEEAAASDTELTAEVPQAESEAITETEQSAAVEPTIAVEPTEESSVAERPAWQSLPLTNARTGESFTLGDFAGKTVFVEPFATWCTNCRQQLTNVNQVRPSFGEDVVFIALSVEPNIGNEALAQYATEQGFDLIFAAMSPDLLRELVALHGQTITNPPATPHFIIRADGSVTELVTGIEDPEAITLQIQSAQG